MTKKEIRPESTACKRQWNDADFYKIGKLGKPHGVKGELSLMFDDDIFDRTDADYLVLAVDGLLVPFFFEAYRFKGSQTALVKFCDIDTQEQARELTGCDVFFPRWLAETDSEDVSWLALVGFCIIDAMSNKSVGEILSIDDTTLNLLFEVRTVDGKELLIPASEQLITGINTTLRHVYVRLPEGILDLD